MMKKIVIGVIGPGESARDEDKLNAYEVGKFIAQEGWVLLTGGRNAGVMDAACRGAKAAGGLTIGILPTRDRGLASPSVDIPIITDMGSARNNINVLSSQVVIACGMSTGTASEVALALKARRAVILLTDQEEGKRFFKSLRPESIYFANDPGQAGEIARKIVSKL